MAFKRGLQEKEELWRNALVHPTPRGESRRGAAVFREGVFFNLTISEVGTLVDAVVSLVRKISKVVGPQFGSIDIWLRNRDGDGTFPVDTFD